MRHAWVLALLLVGCKRDDVVLCEGSTAKWRQVQEMLANQGLRGPVTDDEVRTEQARCVDAVDKLKSGPKDCLGRCYAKAPDRDALLDCDRNCSVVVQQAP